MKILLCCVAGVTSTMFSTKLKEAAGRRRVDATVWSASANAVEYSIELADIVLIEPQLRYKAEEIQALDPNKPVIVIGEEDFKNFNAMKIFDMAAEAVK